MTLNNIRWLETMEGIRQAILQSGSGGDVSKVETMLSDKWNNTQTYNVGDYAINNDILWKALQTNTGVIPSEGSTWTKVKITDDILQLNSTIYSHVGMIIHSTTLDTEAKVKQIYGGTSWSKIEGRFLLGESTSYPVNGEGGTKTNTLSIENMPSHDHSIPALSGKTNKTGGHQHIGKYSLLGQYITILNSMGSGSKGTIDYDGTGSNITSPSGGEHEHTITTNASTSGKRGGGVAVNNMPPYKTVYIWERTA